MQTKSSSNSSSSNVVLGLNPAEIDTRHDHHQSLTRIWSVQREKMVAGGDSSIAGQKKERELWDALRETRREVCTGVGVVIMIVIDVGA